MDTVVQTLRDEVGIAVLAKALGNITPQAISQWKRVPPGRAIDVESATGISRHILRPDIFGPEPVKTGKGRAA